MQPAGLAHACLHTNCLRPARPCDDSVMPLLCRTARAGRARATGSPLRTTPVLLGALLLSCASVARAQSVRPAVGNGPNALAAVDTVPVLIEAQRKLAANATLGYGYTEAVIDEGDAHHRAGTQLAISYAPNRYLGLAGRVDGRVDAHHGTPDGEGPGVALQSLLIARAGVEVTPALRVGGEAALRFPAGSNAGRGLSAVSGELRSVLTLSPPRSELWLSSVIGFRLDRAREGVEDTDRLSPSDRVALGASDWNAVLLGLAASRKLGAFDLVGEWSWDMQVGAAAPPPLQSPMRVAAGARWFPSSAMHVQLLAGVSPSTRPAVAAGAPLYLFEPRVWLTAAFGWYFERGTPAPPRLRGAQATPTAQPAETAALRGRVVDAAGGAPLPGARVEVQGRDAVVTDTQGNFWIADLPRGEIGLRVTAAGFGAIETRASAAAGRIAEVQIPLERALPDGQIRGTVRGFDGIPVAAQIRLEPGGAVLQAAADGSFEIDVAPGDYTVIIDAPGYRSQRRAALVEFRGVTVIVVELSAAQ